MKLYFSPGACSLAPHIVLREAGLKFDAEKVDLAAKKTASGADFRAVNPKGYVPALALDNGEMLTEVASMLPYIAEQAPQADLAPNGKGLEGYRLREWLTFVSSEIHKGLGIFWIPDLPENARPVLLKKLGGRLDTLDAHLAQNKHLLGDAFSIADAYLFTVLRWAAPLKIDLSGWKNISSFIERIGARPHVQAALKAEGLA